VGKPLISRRKNRPGGALLAGRGAVVTAAAGSGIGFATARRLLEEGARVVVSDRHERRLGEARERAMQILVRHREDLERVVTVLLERESLSGEEFDAIASGETGALPVRASG